MSGKSDNSETLTALVTSEWLAENLEKPGIKLLDATWHMPDSGRDAKAEFKEAHLPGARFFDLDGVSDPDNPLPHMLPTPEHFSTCMQSLGLDNADMLIVYDCGAVHAAARAWWMFWAFGHSNVAVLDGGIQKWRAEGRPLESSDGKSDSGDFCVEAVNTSMVASIEDVKQALGSGAAAVLDARQPGRFSGVQQEPRPGLRSGHMRGAKNLYYADLYGDDGCMKDVSDLKRMFAAAGIDPAGPVITTCGSGVTACALSLALVRVGNPGNRVYDGSWVDWGGRADTEVAGGPTNK